MTACSTCQHHTPPTYHLTVSYAYVCVGFALSCAVCPTCRPGVWRQPVSGRYCRVDVKVYRRAQLPFAVNYFASGTDFNRAIRCG